MIPRSDIDAMLNRFMFEIQSSKLSSPEEAATVADCLAITLATSVHEVTETARKRGVESEEDIETQFRAHLLALDAVTDAVKKIVYLDDIPERMHVYHTLVDLLADPETE